MSTTNLNNLFADVRAIAAENDKRIAAEKATKQVPAEAKAKKENLQIQRARDYFVGYFPMKAHEVVARLARSHNLTEADLESVLKWIEFVLDQRDQVGNEPLIMKTDVEKQLREKFALGVVLAQEHGAELAEGHYAGMRQSWFPQTYEAMGASWRKSQQERPVGEKRPSMFRVGDALNAGQRAQLVALYGELGGALEPEQPQAEKPRAGVTILKSAITPSPKSMATRKKAKA